MTTSEYTPDGAAATEIAPWAPLTLRPLSPDASPGPQLRKELRDPELCPELDLATMMRTEPDPYDWILPGLPAGRVGMLAAPGGSGKSWLSLQWSLALAGGWSAPWPADLHQPQEPRHVLVVTAEETALDLHHRLWALGSRLTADERSAVAKHLHVHPMVGMSLVAYGLAGELAVALGSALAARQHALVILDPLVRLSEIDENDNRAGTGLVNVVDQLARDSGAAIVLLHHVGKAALRAGDGDQSAARGATALVDGVRWMATLRPAIATGDPAGEGMDEGERRRWKTLDLPKLNYAASTPNITYRQGENGIFVVAELPAPAAGSMGKGRGDPF